MRPLTSLSSPSRLTHLAAALSLSALLAACGGGGGGGSSSTDVLPQSAVGIWQGTSTDTSATSILIAAPNNQYFLFGKNNLNNCAGLSIGQYGVNGNIVSGSGVADVVISATIPGVNTNCSFPDGTSSANISFSGTVSAEQTMSLTSSTVTSAGTKLSPSTVNYQWSSLNSIAPSLSTLAGNYANADTTISIKNDGSLVSADISTGCIISGTIYPFDSTHNIYNFSAVTSGCQGNYAFENGLKFSGLAAIDNTTTPVIYIGGTATTSSGITLLIGYSLLKTS